MRSTTAVALLLLLALPAAAQPCPCDCNDDRSVRVNELTTGVSITLERMGMDRCPPADSDGSTSVEVNDLIAGVLAALDGCPSTAQPTPTRVPQDLTAESLAAARALWESQGLAHYQYRYRLGCFCYGPHDVVTEVFHDRITGFRDPVSGEPLTVAFGDLYFTIDGLFDHIEAQLGNAETLRAEFDPTTGHPTEVFIDGSLQIADDELWISVSDLEPLQLAGACRTANDCDVAWEICVEPGGFAGCGVCFPHEVECETDGDCGGGICEEVGYSAQTCACDSSVLVCKPGCDDDDDCAAGQACGDDRHCAAIACRPPDRPWIEDSCPPSFACNAIPPLAGTCERVACQSDSDCGERVGICVNGLCQSTPGRCDVVPP